MITVTIVLSLCLICAGVVGVSLVRNLRQGRYLDIATATSRQFLEAIHDGNTNAAYSMLSDRFEPRITSAQFEELIQRDRQIFATYQRLDVCQWGLFMDEGLVIDLHGLLHYGGGVVVVQISLHDDSDGFWRIQGLRLDAATSPRPYGLCK